MVNKFSRLSLTWKFVAALLVAACTSAVAIGGGGYFVAEDHLEASVRDDLASPLSLRSARLKEYENALKHDLDFFSSLRDVSSATTQFTKALEKHAETADVSEIQRAYTDDNPHPFAERMALDKAEDGTKYSTVHSLLHPSFRAFLVARGLYDVFLINPDGTIVYSVVKEADFLTSVCVRSIRRHWVGAGVPQCRRNGRRRICV